MRDDFTEEAKRTLAARAGNVCSNPDCRALTSGPRDDSTKAVSVGVAAHITSAAEGGPRYDPSLTSEARRHPNNGIWLCQTCAKLIDNDPPRFTEKLVRAWKEVAEDRARNSIGKTTTPQESESQRKQRAILPWVGEIVTLSQMNTGRAAMMGGPARGHASVRLLGCTEFHVIVGTPGSEGSPRSIAMRNIVPCPDEAHNRLELQEYQ